MYLLVIYMAAVKEDNDTIADLINKVDAPGRPQQRTCCTAKAYTGASQVIWD